MRLLAVLAILIGLFSGVARAQAPLSASQRETERRAQSLFAAGRYQEAVGIYADLWADNHDPIYLRNIGRCYQKLRDPERAISSFEEYLAKARRLSAGERREIDGYLRDMRALKDEQEAARAREVAPAPRVEPSPPVALPQPVVKSEPPPPTVVALPPAPFVEDTGKTWRRTGWVGLGLAAALAAGGGVMLWSSWSRFSESNNRCAALNNCGPAADAVASRILVSRLLFAGAGAVGVASGLVIFLHPAPDGARGMIVGGARVF